MANVLVEDSTMSAIGNAIRNKTGKAELMLPADMPGEISGIIDRTDEFKEKVTEFLKRELTEVDISNSGITEIGDYAFNACEKLTSFSFPETIKRIKFCAFQSCTSLTTITFSGKPEFIHATSFEHDTNLLTINAPWAEGEVENAPWGAVNATVNYNYKNEVE